MKKTLRIGFIGCGGIANQKHFPGMYGIEGVELVAFCDLIIERAEKAANRRSSRSYPERKALPDLLRRYGSRQARSVREADGCHLR